MPENFIVVDQTARKEGLGVSELVLKSSWGTPPPSDGGGGGGEGLVDQLTVVGLQLEGASLTGHPPHTLTRNTADSPDVCIAPPVQLRYVKSVQLP